jgi:purine nucleosidase
MPRRPPIREWFRLNPFVLTPLIAVTAAAFCCSAHGAEAVPIIFDTDIESDVDDVGSVALLHALADAGEARIVAMGVSAGHTWCVPCLDALNTYFGRPDIPIGAVKGAATTNKSNYAESIAREFAHDLPSNDAAPDAAHVYRALLAKEKDGSVVIVSVGFLTNLRNLLQTKADGHSPLNGRQLVQRKVRLWVCMGAVFPHGREWNVHRDAAASREAISQWPTPIVFSGFEIGAQIKTGAGLRSLPENSPVRRAYELYNGLNDRESWDQTAVLFAVRGHDEGLAELWDLSAKGCCHVAEDGSNTWEAGADCEHRHLIAKAPAGDVANIIEQLMKTTPHKP